MRPCLEQLEDRCVPNATAVQTFAAIIPQINSQMAAFGVQLQQQLLPSVTQQVQLALAQSGGQQTPYVVGVEATWIVVATLPQQVQAFTALADATVLAGLAQIP